MTEHPILFSTPMVKAILKGRKTMTRRIIKDIHSESQFLPEFKLSGFTFIEPDQFEKPDNEKMASIISCSYGQPGDLLWVREKFAKTIGKYEPEITYSYFADSFHWSFFPEDKTNGETSCQWHDPDLAKEVAWKPSIHMPKVAARIWLQVEEIRVERLNEISEKDAFAEGIIAYHDRMVNGIRYTYQHGQLSNSMSVEEEFKKLFISINKKPKPLRERGETGKIVSYSAIAWDQNDFDTNWSKYNGIYRNKPLDVFINPWVWVVKYKILSTSGKPLNIEL